MQDNGDVTETSRMRWDKGILVAGMVADRIGLSLLYIVFGPLVRELGLSEIQFGVLLASANVALGIASPFWGHKSQTLGRKPVLIIGLSGYALGFIALALTLQAGLQGSLNTWPLFFILLAVRLFYGLVAAGTQPAATAYIADITDRVNRARGMALIGVAAGIGTVLGPAIGGILTGFGAVLPLYVAGILSAIAAIIAFIGLREPHKPMKSATETGAVAKIKFTDARIFPYLLGWFVIVMVLTGIQTITAFLIEDDFGLTATRAVTQATSVAFLIMGVAMVFTQGVVLQKFRIAPAILLRTGFGLFGAGLLILAVAANLASLYIAYACMGIGYSAINPGLNAGASISFGNREQGGVAGLLSAAPVLGMIFGPITATALYGINPLLPVVLGAVLSIALAFYFLRKNSPA
jgi:MFS family permease